ncbi:hypothetical protein HRbin36_01280 [bacterium HR36]|nr:hypothetical protein HRbin36_01280 [bacterium HR36]
MCYAKSGTRKHGDYRFGNQRQVNGDAVAFAKPQLFQDVGKSAHLAVQIDITQHPRLARLPFPDNGHLVTTPAVQVPIQAVKACIELATDKPLRKRFLPLQNLLPLTEPMQYLGLFRPETFGVIVSPLPECPVFVQTLDMRLLGELRWGRKNPAFAEHALDHRTSHGRHRHGSPPFPHASGLPLAGAGGAAFTGDLFCRLASVCQFLVLLRS